MFFFGKKAKLANICCQIVAHAEDGVVVINKDHDIILYNQSAERIFGYTQDEAIGEPLDLLLPERFHTQHDMLVEEFGKGSVDAKHMGYRTRQTLGRRKDGVEFVASIAIIRIGSGNQHYAAIIRDVSDNRKTEEDLLRLAATDPLTGVYNRREFSAIAEREAQRANRYNRPLSILLIDLDYFKRLNDVYGHASGDKVLQRFASICSSTLRNVDIFGRWGGEEFVALLPETDIEGAMVIAERLRKMASENVLTYNGQKINFTVSLGVAQFKSGETSIDLPLSRADSAVYDAKKAGRNRVSVYRN